MDINGHGEPEHVAETHEAMRGVDQRLALCLCSDASWKNETPEWERTTKAKKNTISANRQLSGKTDAVTCFVNKPNLTIKIKLRMTIANVGSKDITPKTPI